MEEISPLVYRLTFIAVLVSFLPLSAATYYNYRLGQRKLEIERILNILEIVSEYRNIHTYDIGRIHFSISVLFATAVSLLGLCALVLSAELDLANSPNLLLSGSHVALKEGSPVGNELIVYQQGALLAYGIGFMGAYLWGLQSIFRRYSMNDLLPVAFFHFGLRMIFASFAALLIYHAVGGFQTNPAPKEGQDLTTVMMPTSDGLLLITVFLVGMFPQRGVKWMTSKVGRLISSDHPSVQQLPLEMIQGMTAYDKDRLEELGIDSCYDLATADFIPMLLKTPYPARELIDWILQAKLCVRFGESVDVLRQQGLRTINDLEGLDDEFLDQLARDTPLTLSSLKKAARFTETDFNISRLRRAADSLGKYWEGEPDEKNSRRSPK